MKCIEISSYDNYCYLIITISFERSLIYENVKEKE